MPRTKKESPKEEETTEVPSKKTKKSKKEEEIEIPDIIVNADQLSFDHDKDIDNMARYLEERIPPFQGLKECVRSKNNITLKLTKPVSKRVVKQYLAKYLHRAGLRLDYRVLGTYQGRKEADFHIYPRRVFEV